MTLRMSMGVLIYKNYEEINNYTNNYLHVDCNHGAEL